MSMAVSVSDWGRGDACERVKGDFESSFRPGTLIASRLRGSDGSECSMYGYMDESLHS